MTTPTNDNPRPFSGAFAEIGSALSSLAMDPEPIKTADPLARYLCDTDRWAKHAVEHLYAAHDYVRKAERDTDRSLRALTVGLQAVRDGARIEDDGRIVIPPNVLDLVTFVLEKDGVVS